MTVTTRGWGTGAITTHGWGSIDLDPGPPLTTINLYSPICEGLEEMWGGSVYGIGEYAAEIHDCVNVESCANTTIFRGSSSVTQLDVVSLSQTQVDAHSPSTTPGSLWSARKWGTSAWGTRSGILNRDSMSATVVNISSLVDESQLEMWGGGKYGVEEYSDEPHIVELNSITSTSVTRDSFTVTTLDSVSLSATVINRQSMAYTQIDRESR